MKIALSALAALVVFTAAAPSQQTGSAQGAKPSFSLNISATQDVIQSGSAVTVTVVMTNTSDHKLSFIWSLGDEGRNYELNVRDGEGNPAQPAPRGWKDKDGRFHARHIGSSIRTLHLEPGKTEKEELDVCDFEVLTQPGKYTIQVQRTDLESKSVVKSNTITVTVTP